EVAERAVDVARGYVGLGPVGVGIPGAVGRGDGVPDLLDGLLGAELASGGEGPGGGVHGGAAVLARAGGGAREVAEGGVGGGVGGGEEEGAVVGEEGLSDGVPGGLLALARGDVAEDGPGLGVEVELALGAGGGADPVAVVFGAVAVPAGCGM